MSTIDGNRFRAYVGLVVVAAMLPAGCSGRRSSDFLSEPKSGGQYLVARPTNYDPKLDWPLIVVCHSGFPDSAERQIAEWTRLAEDRGFIVVAPQLTHDRALLGRDDEEARDGQLATTRMILNTVEHVRAGQSISGDRILLYGYGRGAQAALHAGLLHPEIFRAISVNEPVVENDRLAGRWTVDQHQAVHMRFSTLDRLYHEHYSALALWLRSIGADVRADTAGAADEARAARAVAFFELLLRKEPWLTIVASQPDAGQPLNVAFRMRLSGSPRRISWDFGDGTFSTDLSPVHTYTSPGAYEVKLAIDAPDGKAISRTVWLSLPQGTVSRRTPG